MKNNRLSSVVFMWLSFAMGIIAVLMMFCPLMTIGGQIKTAVNAFFDNSSGTIKGAWPAFVGYMLILLATLLTGFLALPFFQPSYAVEKIILIVSSVLLAIGCFLIMMIVVWWCVLNGQAYLITHYGYHLYPGTYIAGSLSILSILCNIRAITLDK